MNSSDVMAKTQELLKEGEKSILFTSIKPNAIMERGVGLYLWDTTGKRYLDFMGGWAVTCLGHCPPVITKALEQQSRELVNASPSFYNKPMIQFAKLLTEISCFDKVFFGSSGAEANEGAIKLARKYGSIHRNGAYEIITTINSFHGRTLATIAGVVGGGMLGNSIEKSKRQTVSYEVTVRMEDGTNRLIDSESMPSWHIGDKVKVVGGAIVSR